jgi:hypothetical protein
LAARDRVTSSESELGRSPAADGLAGWRWSAAAAIAVLAASAWVRSPSVLYLALGLLATVAAALLAGRRRRAGWIWATVAALVLANLFALPRQIDLYRVANSWPSWELDASRRADGALRRELDRAIVEAQTAADAALRRVADRATTFDLLAPFAASTYDRGIVAFEGDSVVAWSGEVRLSPDSAKAGIEAVANELYTALRVTKVDAGRRVTAVVLVDANPPADTVSRPLARIVAQATGVRGFDITPITTEPPSTADYVVAGRRLLGLAVLPSTQDEVSFEIVERARIVVSALLALALFTLIVAVWRDSAALGPRIAAVALGLVCIAVVPVNQYSNVSRLFTPAIYFAPIGRQLTANAGALTITTALALLALIAVVRAQRRARGRRWATAIVVLVAVLGPFLLRALADGIQFPSRGADIGLWLMWEIPLFLAGVVVLLAGATAGSSVLGANRGAAPRDGN